MFLYKIENYYSIFTLLCTGYSPSEQFLPKQPSNLLTAYSLMLRRTFQFADKSDRFFSNVNVHV